MKFGDKIKIDGIVSRVVAVWGAGKHVRYALEDGREFLDLHLRKDLEVIVEPPPTKLLDTLPWKRSRQDLPESLPTNEHDDEV